MDEQNGFYRDKSWELLMDEIREIKWKQSETMKDIQDIKSKMSWIFGVAAGITLAVNVLWQWIKSSIMKP